MTQPSSIPTYELIDHSNNKLLFNIRRMEDIYDQQKGNTDQPHRHDFYTIIFAKKASGIHLIDFNEYQLSDNLIFFVSPGQVHQIIEKEQSNGWVITFSREFLEENHIDYCFIEDINLFTDYGQSPPLPLDEREIDILNQYSHQMLTTLSSETKFKMSAIGALLKLFLITCNNICTLEQKNPQQVHAGTTILKAYKNLVENHFSEWHKVHQYAEELHVTPDHLNRTIKLLIGKTAKEYLQSRIIIAAKRMLYFSDLTTKEISYELGFSEPSNFSNFFKKITGISPSQYGK